MNFLIFFIRYFAKLIRLMLPNMAHYSIFICTKNERYYTALTHISQKNKMYYTTLNYYTPSQTNERYYYRALTYSSEKNEIEIDLFTNLLHT